MVLDFSIPKSILRGPYRFYLHHFLPKLAGLLTGEKDAYDYLAASIEEFPSGERNAAIDRGKRVQGRECSTDDRRHRHDV